MNNARLRGIDAAKGICILLMALSHLYFFTEYEALNNFNHQYLFIFKMPMFIIFSGYLIKEQDNFKKFFIKKLDGLIKPIATIFIATFIILGLYNTVNQIDKNPSQVIQFLKSQYYPLWFVVAIFISLLLFKLSTQIFEKPKFQNFKNISIFLIIFFTTTHINIYYSEINILRFINIIFYFFIYLWIGNFIKAQNLIEKLSSIHTVIYSAGIYILYILINESQSIKINLWESHFQPFFPTLIISLSGSHLVYYTANLLSKTQIVYQILQACSRGSFFIMAFHILIGNYIIYPMLLPHFSDFIFFELLCYVLTIFICLLIRKLALNTLFFNKVMFPTPLNANSRIQV